MYNITKSYYHVLSILSNIYIYICIASTFHSWYFAWNYQRLTPHTNHPFCLKFFGPIGFVLTYPYHVVKPIINFIYHPQVITTFLWDFNHRHAAMVSPGLPRFTAHSHRSPGTMQWCKLPSMYSKIKKSSPPRSGLKLGSHGQTYSRYHWKKKVASCSPPLLSKQKKQVQNSWSELVTVINIYPLLGWFWNIFSYIFMICHVEYVISRADKYGSVSKPWYLVNPKIACKWMFIPLKMVLIGIDP